MRIGLLAGKTLSAHHLQVLQPILADKDFDVPLILVDGRPPKSLLHKTMEHLKKGCGAYILVLALQCFLTEPLTGRDTEEFCRENDIECLETRRPYSVQTADRLRAHHLDVMALLCGFGIIREPLLSVCPKGILSYHHGDMRKYRGMPPGFWELYHGEQEIGITVQRLAAGLDCGVPIVEKHLPIHPQDTLATVQARLRAEDQDMLYAALKRVNDPGFAPTLIRSFGKVYTLPNFRQWITLRARVACRALPGRGSAGSVENLGSCQERPPKRS